MSHSLTVHLCNHRALGRLGKKRVELGDLVAGGKDLVKEPGDDHLDLDDFHLHLGHLDLDLDHLHLIILWHCHLSMPARRKATRRRI